MAVRASCFVFCQPPPLPSSRAVSRHPRRRSRTSIARAAAHAWCTVHAAVRPVHARAHRDTRCAPWCAPRWSTCAPVYQSCGGCSSAAILRAATGLRASRLCTAPSALPLRRLRRLRPALCLDRALRRGYALRRPMASAAYATPYYRAVLRLLGVSTAAGRPRIEVPPTPRPNPRSQKPSAVDCGSRLVHEPLFFMPARARSACPRNPSGAGTAPACRARRSSARRRRARACPARAARRARP